MQISSRLVLHIYLNNPGSDLLTLKKGGANKLRYQYLRLKKINIEEGNVAGIHLPLFTGVEFEQKAYDLMLTPLWVDKAIEAIKETITLKAKLLIYHKQIEILKEELRIATQRVNLFEKIKIPESQENIRVIQIYLGELQTAGVVRGKIAKAKLERKRNAILQ